MGWGGNLYVVNATPYTWTRVYQPAPGAGDMSAWHLPSMIDPGKSRPPYCRNIT